MASVALRSSVNVRLVSLVTAVKLVSYLPPLSLPMIVVIIIIIIVI